MGKSKTLKGDFGASAPKNEPHVEEEIKYVMDEATWTLIKREQIDSKIFVQDPVSRDERTNIYSDTEDFDLYRMQIDCRARLNNKKTKYKYDLKTPFALGADEKHPDPNGVFSRLEHRVKKKNPEVTLKHFKEYDELKDFLKENGLYDKKTEAFVHGYFKRDMLLVHPKEGAEIEVALEKGYYQTIDGKHRSPLQHIIELELKKGTYEDLIGVAKELEQRYGISPCMKTKGEMGLEFVAEYLPSDKQNRFIKARELRFSPVEA